jgi:class 3 adenylate cyclase
LTDALQRELVLALGSRFRARGWHDEQQIVVRLARHLAAGHPVRVYRLTSDDRRFLQANRLTRDELNGEVDTAGADSIPAPVRIRTLLFTDLVGSTARASQLGDGPWSELLGEHNRRTRKVIEAAGGDVVEGTGDGVLAMFVSPETAIRAAMKVVAELRKIGLEVRVGVHTAQIVDIDGANIGGIGVHLASRVMSAAGTGEILVSEATRSLVAGTDLAFDAAGPRRFKGIPDEIHVYRVKQASGGLVADSTRPRRVSPRTGPDEPGDSEEPEH